MPEVKPLPAATVTLVRDADDGIEVLVLQRNFQSGFMPGMYLFPGGALDASDFSEEAMALCPGIDDATASGLLKLERGGLAYWIAAIRESFEEAGLLLAYDAGGEMIALNESESIERFGEYRRALNAGEQEFMEMLSAEGLRLAADQLVFFSHWITPVGAPRRYDTRFFIARAPAGQEVLHDNRETIGHRWVRPQAALAGYASGEFKMRTPTLKTLELFSRHSNVSDLLDALRAQGDVPAFLPRVAKDGRRVLPGEPGYEEAESPEGRGKWET